MTKELTSWLEAGRHLPASLRDFHDQKAVFAAMHALQDTPSSTREGSVDHLYDVSPVVGQVYVIDRFLWFMARRGWTLQRSRADLPFASLDEDVKAVAAARRARFGELVSARGSRVA